MGKKTKEDKAARKEYTLEYSFEPRLIDEHLGLRKYPKSVKAICELVANGFDAEATSVEVETEQNELDAVGSITIRDNGRGISPEVLALRFAVVGVAPIKESLSTCFSRFGVGRFAAHRIGTLSTWESVSKGPKASRIKVTFTLSSEAPDKLAITERL